MRSNAKSVTKVEIGDHSGDLTPFFILLLIIIIIDYNYYY